LFSNPGKKNNMAVQKKAFVTAGKKEIKKSREKDVVSIKASELSKNNFISGHESNKMFFCKGLSKNSIAKTYNC